MGWNVTISFGVADTEYANNANAGMFVGLVTETSMNWNLQAENNNNLIGIGHKIFTNNIKFINNGSEGPFVPVSTQWTTFTPDYRWFHLRLTNNFNSQNVTIQLTEAFFNISESTTVVCNIASNLKLYPCIQRFMGNSANYKVAILYFGQITINQLITP